MKTVALFDIADQSFTFFTDEEWEKQIKEWLTELEDDGCDTEGFDAHDIVDHIGGDEYFWDNIA